MAAGDKVPRDYDEFQEWCEEVTGKSIPELQVILKMPRSEWHGPVLRLFVALALAVTDTECFICKEVDCAGEEG